MMWYDTAKMADEVADLKKRLGNMPPEMAEERIREEAEAGWQRIHDCVVAFKAGPNILSGGRFDTLSLGTWIEIAGAADITFVPVLLAALPSGKDIFASGFAPVPLELTEDMEKYHGVVRLDNCGSAALKQKMGVIGNHGPSPIEGAILIDGRPHFVFDERTSRGAMEYVGQIGTDGDVQHPIWWRPWVTALPVEVARPRFMGRGSSDTWPLEWRVIVQGGAVAAVSAYYIQAPVTMTDTVQEHLRSVVEQTGVLLAFMNERSIQPWHPRYIDVQPEDEVSFTIDFISTPAGPAFLEAGPAVPVDDKNVPVEIWGAHPCNFIGKPVSGVALSRDDVRPLPT